MAESTLGKTYAYELPYTIDDNYLFKYNGPQELERLYRLRVLAQHAIEKVVKTYELSTDIRIWPHHFDTGGFASLSNTKFHIGFGLAIPGSLCDDHYFYLSAYSNNKMVATEGFKKLDQGTWIDDGFKGGILSAKEVSESEAMVFFKAAVSQLQHLND